jgi:type I restriction enzyme S subunit
MNYELKKYPKYKPSGIEWIGEIPEHWEVKKFKYLYKSNMGPTILKSDLETDGNIPVYSATESDAIFGYVKNTSVILDPGDIVIPARGNSIGFVTKINQKATCTQTTIYSKKIFNGFNDAYVVYYLKGLKDLLFQFDRTAIPQITVSQIKENPIIFPPIEEQTAIANFLDEKTAKIDSLIEKKKKLIELYKEEKTALINQAVTRGINPNVKLKPSGVDWLGDIPEHWEVKKLKYVSQIISGASFDSFEFTKSGNVRVLKISNIQHDYIDWSDEEFISDAYSEKYQSFRVFNGDIIFALTRPIISSGIKSARAFFNDKEIVLLNQRNAILRVGDKVDPSFIYFVTHSNYFFRMFELSIDKTGQQPNISTLSIMNFGIILPPLNDQHQIVHHIESETKRIDDKIARAEKEIELLQEYRTALISEVVTGKIKVIDN